MPLGPWACYLKVIDMAVVIRGGRPVEPGESGQVPVTRNWVNVEQEVLHVTVDRLKLCLSRWMAQIRKSRDWVAPLGIALTILGTLAGSTFRDNWLTADQWQTLFVLALLGACVWLAVASINAFRGRVTIETIVEELTKGTASTNGSD